MIHKTDKMIDLTKDKCIYESCNIIASFNIKGKKKGIYCKKHKKDEMIDIKHKTCIYIGCNTRPSYNLEGLSY